MRGVQQAALALGVRTDPAAPFEHLLGVKAGSPVATAHPIGKVDAHAEAAILGVAESPVHLGLGHAHRLAGRKVGLHCFRVGESRPLVVQSLPRRVEGIVPQQPVPAMQGHDDSGPLGAKHGLLNGVDVLEPAAAGVAEIVVVLPGHLMQPVGALRDIGQGSGVPAPDGFIRAARAQHRPERALLRFVHGYATRGIDAAEPAFVAVASGNLEGGGKQPVGDMGQAHSRLASHIADQRQGQMLEGPRPQQPFAVERPVPLSLWSILEFLTQAVIAWREDSVSARRKQVVPKADGQISAKRRGGGSQGHDPLEHR